MQSQPRPGEVRAGELVKRDHPGGSVLPASDSRHEQPHGQRLPTWAGGGPQPTSAHSTPSKDGEPGAVQRPFGSPSHLPAAERPDPHLGLNLASWLFRRDLG